jgi:putative ATP-binding cassette transporter
MPRGTPYLPRGSLREVLAYPLKPGSFDDAVYENALRRLGLERLLPQLDLVQRWERELSQDEQLALAFARLVLRAPPWVLIDDAFGSVDDETLNRIVDVLRHELAGAGVIHIGRAEGHDALFPRVLHLVKAADGHGARSAP